MNDATTTLPSPAIAIISSRCTSQMSGAITWRHLHVPAAESLTWAKRAVMNPNADRFELWYPAEKIRVLFRKRG